MLLAVDEPTALIVVAVVTGLFGLAGIRLQRRVAKENREDHAQVRMELSELNAGHRDLSAEVRATRGDVRAMRADVRELRRDQQRTAEELHEHIDATASDDVDETEHQQEEEEAPCTDSSRTSR